MTLSFSESLDNLRTRNLYRRRRTFDGPQGSVVNADGRQLVNFCSNDYLGLANDPRVIEAFAGGAHRCGVGSGASHLVCGHHRIHQALEEELAAATGRARALLFSTGYMANLGIFTAFARRNDLIFQDRLNHASLIDGARISGAHLKRYPHGDLVWLRRRMQKTKKERQLLATDAVFSMDGDFAPLTELSALATESNAMLIVDDAHGFGVLGSNGGGMLEQLGLTSQQVPVLMATLGKALGVFGAFVAGDEELIETLIQFARPYIYTTALPPALAQATRASLRIAREEPWHRKQLMERIEYFRRGADHIGLKLSASRTAIQPLIVGTETRALELSEALFEKGLLVAAIRPPTVPRGTARLRITLSAAHTRHQIDQLLDTLATTLSLSPTPVPETSRHHGQ